MSAHLILGGARSGKSALAQRLAEQSGLAVTYVATATPWSGDEEMAARIARHQADRPASWALVEEPIALAEALQRHARPDGALLVDCLTLWLNNLLLAEDEALFAVQKQALLDVLPSLPGQTLLVSNETGLGVIPMGELTRRFVDEAGWLHQALSQRCDNVTLCMAGLSLPLKPALHTPSL
ncbi:bifunctional adenosylcobinamide kinase/adenosylcobinamide-phosphate guanylyltransferase [Magnetofaba australis]|uniref:Bifunctional adenosylcobalamin biosynthesis protein n=1 Tax=Magnetofaba australis IT-1 TaxID=1434232 RepID=A0A1Y2K3K1_9PROT|nr:bifunctional adenosylcobinamide kinase/adenosylcobinamide-phosphate guanylyltransferase [Magnetofaba australis]OSM02519.1 putative adenosylcobinamide kinase/adenosylcobinamide-phosphate guanylyltransferase [Magnetofaba australis IT-1]